MMVKDIFTELSKLDYILLLRPMVHQDSLVDPDDTRISLYNGVREQLWSIGYFVMSTLSVPFSKPS
jgi:hypothetical protein